VPRHRAPGPGDKQGHNPQLEGVIGIVVAKHVDPESAHVVGFDALPRWERTTDVESGVDIDFHWLGSHLLGCLCNKHVRAVKSEKRLRIPYPRGPRAYPRECSAGESQLSFRPMLNLVVDYRLGLSRLDAGNYMDVITWM
jgi:hypothetical protein